jgi:DNA primase
MPLTKPVITAAATSLKPRSAVVNQDKRHKHPRLDYAAIRQQITMTQVLDHLGCLKSLKGRRPQLRGPCPIHGQADDARRSFSVHLDKQVFRCFHKECDIQGNVLDLWAAVRRLPLYEATVDLAQTFNLRIEPNREEEPVRRVQRKPR